MSDDQNIEYAIWDRAQRRHADRAEQKRRAERYDDLLLGVVASIGEFGSMLAGKPITIEKITAFLVRIGGLLTPEDIELAVQNSIKEGGYTKKEAASLRRALCRVSNQNN